LALAEVSDDSREEGHSEEQENVDEMEDDEANEGLESKKGHGKGYDDDVSESENEVAKPKKVGVKRRR
jgi:hypothetical protein